MYDSFAGYSFAGKKCPFCHVEPFVSLEGKRREMSSRYRHRGKILRGYAQDDRHYSSETL